MSTRTACSTTIPYQDALLLEHGHAPPCSSSEWDYTITQFAILLNSIRLHAIAHPQIQMTLTCISKFSSFLFFAFHFDEMQFSSPSAWTVFNEHTVCSHTVYYTLFNTELCIQSLYYRPFSANCSVKSLCPLITFLASRPAGRNAQTNQKTQLEIQIIIWVLISSSWQEFL